LAALEKRPLFDNNPASTIPVAIGADTPHANDTE